MRLLIIPKCIRAEFCILSIAKRARIDVKKTIADAKTIDACRAKGMIKKATLKQSRVDEELLQRTAKVDCHAS